MAQPSPIVRCGDCDFWITDSAQDPTENRGWCYLHPPVLVPMQPEPKTLYPITLIGWGCGDGQSTKVTPQTQTVAAPVASKDQKGIRGAY